MFLKTLSMHPETGIEGILAALAFNQAASLLHRFSIVDSHNLFRRGHTIVM